MMAGAVATLAAQWGLIPRLSLSPRALILWGAMIAAAGLIVTMCRDDLYGIVIGFGLASLGFGFTRPGLHRRRQPRRAAGRARRRRRRGHRRQRHRLCRSHPGIGMLLYAVDPHLPFVAGALLLLGLLLWGRRGSPPCA